MPFGESIIDALVPGRHMILLISGYSLFRSSSPYRVCCQIQMKPTSTRKAQYITIVLVPTSAFVFKPFLSFRDAAFCPNLLNVPDQFNRGTVMRQAAFRIE